MWKFKSAAICIAMVRRTSVTFRIHWSINFYSIAPIDSSCAKSQMIYREEIEQHSWLQGTYKSAQRRTGMKSLFPLLKMFSLIFFNLAQILLPTWGYSWVEPMRLSFETTHSLYIFYLYSLNTILYLFIYLFLSFKQWDPLRQESCLFPSSQRSNQHGADMQGNKYQLNKWINE